MLRTGTILAVICAVLIVPSSVFGRAGIADGPGSVPRVVYIKPFSQSTVDISDGKAVVLSWAMLPIPSGTRDSFRFVLYKGPGYGFIMSKTVDDRTFSVEVPAEKLEPGAQYWWYVKQRDARTMAWSEYDIWYFKVVKK